MENTLAIEGIRTILKETNELHGWLVPEFIVNYEARILASKIDRSPWQPEPSYAERYLQLRTAAEALELANTCWFTRAVFPELKSRHGIQSSYYVQLGSSCYERVLQHSEIPTVSVMMKNFEFLAETAYMAIRHYGQFRSMWD